MRPLSQLGHWLRDELPFVCVIVIELAGVLALTFWPDHWRRDVAVLSFGLFVAGVLRWVLPRSRAGMLVARRGWFDVIAYLALGGVILGVAIRLH